MTNTKRVALALVAVAGAFGFRAAQAEDVNPVQNTAAAVRVVDTTAGLPTHDASVDTWLNVSWTPQSNISKYQIWGKVQLKQFIGFFPNPTNYAGYSYYAAFNGPSIRSRWMLVGETTSNNMDIFYNAYASYCSYSEYQEYSPYGVYRVVALGATAPAVGLADGGYTMGLPSAETFPAIQPDQLRAPGVVTYERLPCSGQPSNVQTSQVHLRWEQNPNATVYEIYRKRQHHFTNPITSAGKPLVGEYATLDTDTAGLHPPPYQLYSIYNAFDATVSYQEYIFEQICRDTDVFINISSMGALGNYHDYCAYSIYSTYLDYGVFKVVAVKENSTVALSRRSPASAEAVAYSAPAEVLGGSTNSTLCFLTTAGAKRN